MNNTLNKIIYGSFLAIIVGLIAYIIITQPKVKAGNEVLEIQGQIQELKQSIKNHQEQHQNAIQEKDNCIKQCTVSWDKQANDEHLGADADRKQIELLEDRLGLILESVQLQ